jgi:hypothetical protein
MRALVNLLLTLPLWLGFLVVAVAVGFVLWQVLTFRRRFERAVNEAVIEAGAPLKDAQVTVHGVEAVAPPAGPSPYDADEDDENFMEGVDGEPWDEDGVNFYTIDATITPADPTAAWDPTSLALVPADYTPDDAVEISEGLCGLHSAEVFANGRFQPAPEGETCGPRRLRMLFGVHDGLRAVKFALVVTYFGRVELPVPLPRTPKASTKA